MLRKLRAIVTSGILGGCAGAVFGLGNWLFLWLILPPDSTPPIQWSVLRLGLWGTLTGTFFAIGLALFARFRERVALSQPLAMVLGASSGALAYSLLLGPLLEDPDIPYLISVLALYGALGLITGQFLWSVTSKTEEIEEYTTPDQAAIQAPSIVDGTAFRWDATDEPQSSPRPEPRSATSEDPDR